MSLAIEDNIWVHAMLCRTVTKTIRQWGRDVFSGKIENTPETEQRLICAAKRTVRRSKAVFDDCLANNAGAEGIEDLRQAIGDVDYFLNPWVSPKRAVAPSARGGFKFTPEQIEEARQRIAQMEPLPADFAAEERKPCSTRPPSTSCGSSPPR